ncbi:TadG family pilus assembly protein [Caballeronia sordidicola]|uniref:TadG family pilus assembly protein n=1 Tax=Caballeronia sordidicola TaxID=196367 RepID=UPI0004D01911|nr:TadG family pilus assembly protein [Caballeronia sordidicola]
MKRFPTSPSRATSRGRKRQRGVASVLAAFWLLVAVAALAAIDVGNVFYQRRVMQSVADMAANAGAQVVDNACSRAPATALGIAGANGFNASASGNSITTTCGRWDPTLYVGPSYYAANATPSNAVQVTVSKQVPYFFLGAGRVVSATGLAQAVNVGAFTIGTTTASVDPTVITGVLNAMLGTNINTLQISAAGYAGLAQSRIQIGDLVTAAGVGTVNQLLAMNVTAAQLANLMLTALQTTQVANANLSAAVGALQAVVNANIPGSQTFPLGAVNGTPGLLQVGLADTQSALTATISPLDALFVAADIAQAGKSAVSVSTGLNLGIATASLQVQVIQPPVLAIGEAGQTPAGAWRTIATSAQVRAYLVLSLGAVPGSFLGLGSTPLLTLPISLEVTPGTAWLQSTQCAATAAASNSVVGVQPGLANVCVGNPPSNLSASAAFSCSQPATLVSVPNVLTPGVPLLTISVKAPITAVVPPDSSSTLTFDGIVGNADDYQRVNSNRAGHVISYALANLSTAISQGGLVVNTPVPIVNVVIQLLIPGLVSATLSTLVNLLTPILGALDSVLVPVLQLLGVQIGVSTIHDLSLTCGQSQLQY